MTKFLQLYDSIVLSNDPEKMHVLGKTFKATMELALSLNKTAAEELINSLEAVNWCNYLTEQEAAHIVQNMVPKPEWTLKSWETMMETNKWLMEHKPHFNKEALYVTMQMICSDSGATIRGFLSPDASFELAIYKLALDKLTDEDKVFNIRKYFNI